MLSDEQNALIEKVAKERGFSNFSVSTQAGSKKGDNYLGNIFLVTVKEGGGTKETSLILKCALKNEQVRAQMPINACYSREVYLYETVLPAFEKLQEKYPLAHPFKAYAKIYGFSLTEGDEWLLLENITARGFRILDRKVTMDAEHVSTVLEELGKLHSLSFVMKHLEPDQYRKLEVNLKDYFKDYPGFADTFTEGLKKKFARAYETLEGDETATEGLKKYETLIESSFKELEDEQQNSIIIHGDSWCNNMMFRYENTHYPTKPTQLCFLDWQIAKVANPIMDLLYFMFLSASKEVLDDHKTHLRQYYRVLDENLGSVGLEVESVYPFGVFQDDWKRFAKIGLYIAMSMMDTLLKDEQDARTFTDMAEEGDNIFKMFMDQSGPQKDQSYFRIRDIVQMMVENKYP